MAHFNAVETCSNDFTALTLGKRPSFIASNYNDEQQEQNEEICSGFESQLEIL